MSFSLPQRVAGVTGVTGVARPALSLGGLLRGGDSAHAAHAALDSPATGSATGSVSIGIPEEDDALVSHPAFFLIAVC